MNETVKKIIKTIFEWIVAILIAVAIFLVISQFVGRGIVSGESMMPTYKNGEKVFIIKKPLNLERGNVIAFWADKSNQMPTEVKNTNSLLVAIEGLYYNQFDFQNEELHIKRIVGVPGDTVEVKNNNTVYVNGKKVMSSDKEFVENAKYELGEDEYYVIGDNYGNSLDSRIHGPIEKKNIFGKIVNGKERV